MSFSYAFLVYREIKKLFFSKRAFRFVTPSSKIQTQNSNEDFSKLEKLSNLAGYA